MSITSPTTPFTSSQSPTEKGRSKSSAMPDITLPRVSCSTSMGTSTSRTRRTVAAMDHLSQQHLVALRL